MRRFFIDKKCIIGNNVIIEGKEARHIKDVIRLKIGDRFLGFDGFGKNYTLRVTGLGNNVKAEIEKASSKRSDMPRILLACAIPKKSKMDDIIEKAAELGASDIIPLVTERTIVRIDEEGKTAKHKRWEKVALSASKQCGRDTLPRIYKPMSFKDAIKLAEEMGYKKKIIPYVSEGTKYLTEVISSGIKEVAIFIGPEGDFTKKEIDYAKEHGFETVSLGELVLRVETACIFTMSVVYAKIFKKE